MIVAIYGRYELPYVSTGTLPTLCLIEFECGYGSSMEKVRLFSEEKFRRTYWSGMRSMDQCFLTTCCPYQIMLTFM